MKNQYPRFKYYDLIHQNIKVGIFLLVHYIEAFSDWMKMNGQEHASYFDKFYVVRVMSKLKSNHSMTSLRRIARKKYIELGTPFPVNV